MEEEKKWDFSKSLDGFVRQKTGGREGRGGGVGVVHIYLEERKEIRVNFKGEEKREEKEMPNYRLLLSAVLGVVLYPIDAKRETRGCDESQRMKS